MPEEFDGGNPEHVREAKSTAAVKQAKEKLFLRECMASREGRDWFFKILSAGHIYHSSFSTNALTMSYKEGERNMGLAIMADLVQAAPERYLEMLGENGEKDI